MTKRILIADDEPAVRQLLEVVLRTQGGYDVLMAQNGDQLVRMAQEHVPDLVLIDLMMPYLDGYEAIRQLRNDTRTAHLPMIVLTAKSTPDDVVIGFETGADDYITKPFNVPELLARIKGHLRRDARQPVRNPLTGLPGNVLLTEELKYRLRQTAPFALLYVDLDSFKAFNDTYGPARGDRVIKLLAEVLTEVVKTHGVSSDFIGHIGGDDFEIITSPEAIDILCPAVINAFDQRVRQLYDPDDLARGYLRGVDRQGVPRRFPIISLSIGVVTNRQRTFADHEEVSQVAAEMKQFAKQQPGSSYAVDGRGDRERSFSEERRGARLPTILLISEDHALRSFLRAALQGEGYRLLEAPGVLDAHALLAHEIDVALIIADARLGDLLWEVADTMRNDIPNVPLVIISTRPEDEAIGLQHGARVFIQQPFHIEQLLNSIADLVQPGG